MKTMTCRQPGGPCELAHHGQSHDEVVEVQDRHLREAVKAGDTAHREAREAMRHRWRHPKRSMGWYREVRATFESLPGA